MREYKPPRLIEPGVCYFLKENLKQCKKENILFNTLFNLLAFLLFMAILGGTLSYMYKENLLNTKENSVTKKNEDYVLGKIRDVEVAKKRERQELITNLPTYHSNYFSSKYYNSNMYL